ncbi:MAG: (Fe-S)-binding protein [Planctomycetes bacterium]|nr:(Fe-S)-binding protein [Planctomycetota bacterium]
MEPKEVSPYTRTLDCVHCGLCLQACPTYNVLGLETDSPRGRIYFMRMLAEGRIADPEAVRPHLDRCLDCRACETACPSGVRYGEILESVRSSMARQRPPRGFAAWLRRTLLTRLVAHQGRLRFAFALGRLAEVVGVRWLAGAAGILPRHMAVLLPPIPPARERRPLHGTWPARGRERGRVAFFTGCVMEQMFGRIHRATIEVLTANGFTVDVPRAQACCGALLVHDGQAQEAEPLARRNLAAFRDHAVVVNNSAGCGCALKEYGHLLGSAEARDFAARCRDVSEFLHEQGLVATPRPFPHKVAYDDPCHLCHGQGVRKPPRALLGQVPGLTHVPHHDPESCCGSAGIYNLVQPELAWQIGTTKAKALVASGAEAVATGNPGCMLQIRAHLRALGSPMRVVHPVELLVP